eukprot:12411323-Karenia_brevis.AAC.1
MMMMMMMMLMLMLMPMLMMMLMLMLMMMMMMMMTMEVPRYMSEGLQTRPQQPLQQVCSPMFGPVRRVQQSGPGPAGCTAFRFKAGAANR